MSVKTNHKIVYNIKTDETGFTIKRERKNSIYGGAQLNHSRNLELFTDLKEYKKSR
jgi:hypothetical protein